MPKLAQRAVGAGEELSIQHKARADAGAQRYGEAGAIPPAGALPLLPKGGGAAVITAEAWRPCERLKLPGGVPPPPAKVGAAINAAVRLHRAGHGQPNGRRRADGPGDLAQNHAPAIPKLGGQGALFAQDAIFKAADFDKGAADVNAVNGGRSAHGQVPPQ